MAPLWNWLAVGAAAAVWCFGVWAPRGTAPQQASNIQAIGERAGALVGAKCPWRLPPNAPAVTVWVVAGQSQVTTFGMSAATLPAPWKFDRNAYVWVWDAEKGEGRWDHYTPGVNSAPKGQWGPEVQLLRRFRSQHPDAPVAIIKYAPGETGVALDPDRRDWNVRSRGEAWDRLKGMTDSALRPCGLAVSAVFWMGNHTDGYRAEHAATVSQDMQNLVAASRAGWRPDLPWIVGLPAQGAPLTERVRAQLSVLAEGDPRMATFDTEGYETQPDGIHFSASSVIRLGDDFYDGWSALRPEPGGRVATSLRRR